MGEAKITLSYITLLVLTGYALYKYYEEKGTDFWQYPYATFIIIMVNGLLSFYRYMNDAVGESLLRSINCTRILTQTTAFGCYVTEMWLKFGVNSEVNLAHAITGAFLGIAASMADTTENHIINWYVNTEAVSIVLYAFMKENYFAAAAGIVFGVSFFVYRDGRIRFEMMPYVLCNYLHGVFSLLAWFSLNNQIS